MLTWARAAGLHDVAATATAWCFATDDDRAWWGSSWSDRATKSTFADQALAHGLASVADLERIAAAWRRWATEPDGWLAILHGESPPSFACESRRCIRGQGVRLLSRASPRESRRCIRLRASDGATCPGDSQVRTTRSSGTRDLMQ